MSETEDAHRCPHCDAQLKALPIPPGGGYDEEFHEVCFNDDCPYYKRGWDHMWNNYQVKSSYRYRLNPRTGKDSPLAVWSEDALKDRITDG